VATFAYGRVSTKEQSTENQRFEIQQAGYQVDYWFSDEGVSGKVMAQQRPQFARLLGQIRDGETLVVSKLDRLGRDAHDVGGGQDDVDDACGRCRARAGFAGRTYPIGLGPSKAAGQGLGPAGHHYPRAARRHPGQAQSWRINQ
jgi:hypothetical protein